MEDSSAVEDFLISSNKTNDKTTLMPKATRAQKESDHSIFKHLMILVEKLGFDTLEKRLSELSEMAIKSDLDTIRNAVKAEVRKVFGLKQVTGEKCVFSKGGHSSMNEARHQGLMILIAVLHGELGYDIPGIARFLDYEETNIYKKWYSFKALKRDSKVASDREKLEKYDKVVEALKAKKIIQ